MRFAHLDPLRAGRLRWGAAVGRVRAYLAGDSSDAHEHPARRSNAVLGRLVPRAHDLRRAGRTLVGIASATARAVVRGSSSILRATFDAVMSRLPRRTSPESQRDEHERTVVDVHNRVVRRIHTAGLALHNAIDGLPSDHPVTGLLTGALGELDEVVKEVQDAVFRRFRPRYVPAVSS